ncbi:unnamed protein product [Malus baccata var. baccata]
MSASLTPIYREAAPKSRTRDLPLMGEGTCHRTKCDLSWTGFGKGTFSDGGKLMKGRSMNNEDERDGVRGDDDAHASSTWHWHGVGISVLSFSSDGAYLYLGGMEGVFVVWQLDTGKKKFLQVLAQNWISSSIFD